MDISKLSLNELQELKSKVSTQIKLLSYNAFRVGTVVAINKPKYHGIKFLVTKVNTVNCIIKENGSNRRINCPKALLTII
jgi:hypothetical protein